MITSNAIVEVAGLRKTYDGRFDAVRGIDFTIERGETFALLGPNGAGKSTIIEILEGYRDRTDGQVQVLGHDPQHGGLGWKSRLGIVLQGTGEQANATVREQIAHFARLYRNPRDVDDVIEAVGLGDKAATRIKKLSGGQRRRVDVALAIVGNPELVFLDEPTTGFDPEERRQFWDLIGSLKRAGTTILLTTHDLDEAAQLADRAGVVAEGRLVALAAIDELGGAGARIPIVRWRTGGVAHEQRTERPGELVAHLTAHGEPERLEVIRPSLEDIYLSLLDSTDGAFV